MVTSKIIQDTVHILANFLIGLSCNIEEAIDTRLYTELSISQAHSTLHADLP